MSGSSNTASTISTGGAGTTFEHQVAAAFLGSVLAQTFVPIFPSAVASKLHLQTGRLGWKVDDFLLEAVERGIRRRVLAAQVKRTFTLGETDEDCCAVFTAAWTDFHNRSLFNPEADALVLIVHLGSKRLLGDFAWLLQQARTAISAEDFSQRLTAAGLLNKRSRDDYVLVKTILSTATGKAIADDPLWAFLRCFYVLSYDLTSSTGKDEASVMSLLAQLCIDGDPAAAAGTTWAELKSLTGVGAGMGASFSRDTLPEPMRARHRSVGAIEHRAITAIREHSEIVLARVADQGSGGLSFSRIDAAAAALDAVAHSPMTLVVGPAGSGKSVLAKRLIRAAAVNEFTLVFAAEEFRVPHIDQVLVNAQIGVNWSSLLALLGLHPSKTILLEGLERLLESDERGALNDLMQTVANDPTFRLVLTCRDYHAQTIEWVMVRPTGLSLKQVAVPELTDAELGQAAEVFPGLKVPLSSPALRRLLRNPFMLNQAATIDWQNGESLPPNDSALRERLWRMVIRRDDQSRAGLPTRRATTLTNVALLRAKSLRPFVEVAAEDAEAITSLAVDNLIAFDSQKRVRAAPAHDVFEDWALIEWLHAEFEKTDADGVAFAAARDSHPALRRAYRRWLLELIETQQERSRVYVEQVTGAAALPEHLRDDTLIAVLQSSQAKAFLSEFTASLLAGQAEVLQRVMHLVRVSCKTVSPLSRAKSWIEQWYIPQGATWPNVLNFLSDQWDRVPETLHSQVIKFVEEWAQGVSWYSPYPDGATPAGLILEKLWPAVHEGYREESPKHRVLKIMLKVPKSVERTFKDLAARRQQLTVRREDRDAELFGETLLKPFEAVAASRDFPDETIAVSRAVWKATPPEDDGFHRGMREVESVFGLEHYGSPSFFPASALQGPFQSLLQHHPRLAIPFIVRLINDAVELYGNDAANHQVIEPALPIEFTLDDKTTNTVWANSRLWNGYRHLSVMPDVLQSALMALEAWFLQWIDDAESAPRIQEWLLWVLRRSNNVCTIAVVASVCVAHPKATLKASFILLGCRPLFRLDQVRAVQEYGAIAPGGLGVFEQMFQEERIKSNRLSHRRKDLERLAVELVMVDRDRLWAILDAHHAALPEIESQSDEDRLWRLALARMDLRKYKQSEVTEDGYIKIEMAPIDADVQEVVDRGEPERRRFQTRTSLFMWSVNQHERKPEAADKADEWSDRLIEAKQMATEIAGEQPQPGESVGGIGITAAVCLRDHWEALDPTDREWCIDVVLEHVVRNPSGDFASESIGVNPYNGVPACANVASLIWHKHPNRPDALAGLISALTHFNHGVRIEAIKGVAEFLMSHSPREGAFCTWVLVTNAKTEQSAHQLELSKPYDQRSSSARIWWECRNATVEAADDDWYDGYPDLAAIGVGNWAENRLMRDLIYLFRHQLHLPEAHVFFGRIARALKTWWSMERRGRGSDRVDYELQHEAQDALASFLLTSESARLPSLLAPILEAVDKGPKGVGGLMGALLSHEDASRAPTRYWEVWKAIADRVALATWIPNLHHDHHDGHALVRELFLNTRWKENLQVWSRLGSHFRDIDWLYQQLPASSFVLEKYAHYLFHIGRDSMQQALISIAKKHGDQLDIAVAAEGNGSWYLDALLSRAMYTNLSKLKETGEIRQAVMAILNALVNSGSSMAFRLRDDFVTPRATLAA